jgi:hypothetical protein
LVLATLIIWPDIRDDVRRDMARPRWRQRKIAGVIVFVIFLAIMQIPAVEEFADRILQPKLILVAIAIGAAYFGWSRGRSERTVARWLYAIIVVASVVGILIIP